MTPARSCDFAAEPTIPPIRPFGSRAIVNYRDVSLAPGIHRIGTRCHAGAVHRAIHLVNPLTFQNGVSLLLYQILLVNESSVLAPLLQLKCELRVDLASRNIWTNEDV
jgi:hypothetical protein